MENVEEGQVVLVALPAGGAASSCLGIVRSWPNNSTTCRVQLTSQEEGERVVSVSKSSIEAVPDFTLMDNEDEGDGHMSRGLPSTGRGSASPRRHTAGLALTPVGEDDICSEDDNVGKVNALEDMVEDPLLGEMYRLDDEHLMTEQFLLSFVAGGCLGPFFQHPSASAARRLRVSKSKSAAEQDDCGSDSVGKVLAALMSQYFLTRLAIAVVVVAVTAAPNVSVRVGLVLRCLAPVAVFMVSSFSVSRDFPTPLVLGRVEIDEQGIKRHIQPSKEEVDEAADFISCREGRGVSLDILWMLDVASRGFRMIVASVMMFSVASALNVCTTNGVAGYTGSVATELVVLLLAGAVQ